MQIARKCINRLRIKIIIGLTYFEHLLLNLEQIITFPNLLVDVGHLENPLGFVKLVILSLELRKLEEN